MKRTNRVFLAVALTSAVVHASCGSSDPTRVGRPPVVESYQPTDRVINAFVGDTLQFSIRASDPDRDRVETSFYVGDQWVSQGEAWAFAIEDPGEVAIRGRVTDGTHTSYIDWRVTSVVPVDLNPVIETTLPLEPNPILVVGNWMNFAVIASDPEGVVLKYSFSVNDSIVSHERQFSYRASSVGQKRVRALVTDGANTVSHEWQLKVTTVPDNIPPAAVIITLAETGVEPGQVNIEWTAVGRDGMLGMPSLYQVRTSPVPMLTEVDWSRGSDRPGVPAPKPAGETMRMVAGNLLPARSTYIAVRATDDFGNISPLVEPVLVVTKGMRFGGRVIDTVTGEGIPNAIVTFGNESETTGSDGTYEFVEQGFGDGIIAARDELGPEIGNYYDYTQDYSVKHLDVVNLYLIPNYPLQTTYYTDFLTFYRAMTDVGGVPTTSDQRRRALPIALYVRPFVKNDLDYAATIRAVADEFDALLGVPVFVPASDPLPAERVETTYNGTISRDRYSVLTWTQDYFPLAGLIEFRVHYTPDVVEAFKVIIRHELSHSLGLNHSLDPKQLMVGGQAASVSTLTSDEIAVLRSYYTIPRGLNVRRYQRD